jgi:hypothetical protein
VTDTIDNEFYIIEDNNEAQNVDFAADPLQISGKRDRRKSSVLSDGFSGVKGALAEVDDAQLQELGNSIMKEEDEFDIVLDFFPISLQTFWDNFWIDDAKYSMGDYFAEIKEKDIVTTKWEHEASPQTDEVNVEEIKGEVYPIDGAVEELAPMTDNQLQKLKREMKMIVAIKGVPF